MPILELKGVTKEYGQGHTLVQALKPTDFQLEAGQFVAIIGPSGSGTDLFLYDWGHGSDYIFGIGNFHVHHYHTKDTSLWYYARPRNCQ